jgi:hypothetical protein
VVAGPHAHRVPVGAKRGYGDLDHECGRHAAAATHGRLVASLVAGRIADRLRWAERGERDHHRDPAGRDGLRTLPHTEGGEYPTWSPDGPRIAFNSNLSGDHVMYIVKFDGSGLVDLSKVGEGWQVDWAPDGRSILFTSGRDYADPGYDDVYVMRPDGSGVRRLTRQRPYTPAWSPDGEHIVFSAPGLFVMNPDGTGVTPLPTDVGETTLPDWTE